MKKILLLAVTSLFSISLFAQMPLMWNFAPQVPPTGENSQQAPPTFNGPQVPPTGMNTPQVPPTGMNVPQVGPRQGRWGRNFRNNQFQTRERLYMITKVELSGNLIGDYPYDFMSIRDNIIMFSSFSKGISQVIYVNMNTFDAYIIDDQMKPKATKIKMVIENGEIVFYHDNYTIYLKPFDMNDMNSNRPIFGMDPEKFNPNNKTE